MSKYFKSSSLKMYAYLIGIALLFFMWRGGEMINQKLGALEVKRISPVLEKPVVSDPKAFYPVWIKQAVALKAEVAEEQKSGGAVDDLFHKKEEEKPVVVASSTPKEPDYADTFKRNVRVDAIADNGAVLNGEFFKAGSSLNELAIAKPGASQIIPFFVGVTKDTVTIQVEKKSVVLGLPKRY